MDEKEYRENLAILWGEAPTMDIPTTLYESIEQLVMEEGLTTSQLDVLRNIGKESLDEIRIVCKKQGLTLGRLRMEEITDLGLHADDRIKLDASSSFDARTQRLLTSLSFWIPREDREGMISDIWEDCEELAEKDFGRWRIRIHICWALTCAVLCRWGDTLLSLGKKAVGIPSESAS